MKRTLVAALGAALLSGFASAAFTIDGSIEAGYPSTITYQTNDTGFGNSGTGDIFNAGGSELDGVYAQFETGYLNILFTGNLETNFNKFDIFFDAPGVGTGQNVLNTTGSIGGLNGLTFDTGFAPDYFLSVTAGNGSLFVNYSTLVSGTTASIDSAAGYLGTNNGQNGGDLTGGTNPDGLLVALNNSNTAGVGGTNGFSGNPTTVTTGVEFRIPTSMIGNVNYASGARISAFINGSNHDYMSNQILGGFAAGTANPSFDPNNPNTPIPLSAINLNSYAGNQYFAVPEPASMAALGLGLVGIVARRRRASK